MGKTIDRTGEERLNNFGSRMGIVGYRNAHDIDVYFPQYNWTTKNVEYKNFKKGKIKCPYERRVYGIGYLGEGKYNAYENGKATKCYDTWRSMMQRCYDPKLHEKFPTYINCEVCEEWHNYTNFGKWFNENYYEVVGEKMGLDKDILNKGNKIYSPENCLFVSNNINVLFVKHDKLRGDCPIGVHYNKRDKKFVAQCNIYDYEENKSKIKYLGYYNTPEQAFKVYKEYKEKYIKEVADYYKDLIPVKLYDALYKYEVEITD